MQIFKATGSIPILHWTSRCYTFSDSLPLQQESDQGMVVWGASQVALVVKNQCNAGDVRDLGSVPGLRSSPGGGHGNPLQDSCLENPMHRGTWLATVHGVAKSQTRLSSSSGVVGTREASQHQRPWPSRLPQPQSAGSSALHLRPSAAVNTHLVSSTHRCGPGIK